MCQLWHTSMLQGESRDVGSLTNPESTYQALKRMRFIKYLDPQNDVVFRRIFGRENNKDILIAMLNAVLGEQFEKEIVDLRFLPTISHPEVAYQKQSIVDVLCQDRDGWKYIVEMQIARHDFFPERAQFYACKEFSNQLDRGEDYHKLRKVIFLAFTNFAAFEGQPHYKSEHCILDTKTHKNSLDKLSFTFVDLARFRRESKKPLEALTTEERFYHFLCFADEMKKDEVKAFMEDDPIMAKAFEELEHFSWSKIELRTYEAEEKRERDERSIIESRRRETIRAKEKGKREGMKEGMKEGKKAGMKEGEKKKAKKIARDLLLRGIDINIVKESTGLTPQWLGRIKRELQKEALIA